MLNLNMCGKIEKSTYYIVCGSQHCVIWRNAKSFFLTILFQLTCCRWRWRWRWRSSSTRRPKQCGKNNSTGSPRSARNRPYVPHSPIYVLVMCQLWPRPVRCTGSFQRTILCEPFSSRTVRRGRTIWWSPHYRCMQQLMIPLTCRRPLTASHKQ